MKTNHFKTIWISDIHLGTPGCRAEELSKFLQQYTSDKLYLVGDVVDGWALEKRWFWPKEHTQVVQQVLKRAETSEVIYIAGNHDEFLRDLLEEQEQIKFGNIKIINELIHKTVDGKNLWVVHGDVYDIVLKHYKTIEVFGDVIYDLLLWVNGYYDKLRRKFKWRPFSLINYLKRKVRMVERFVRNFEEAVSKEAKIRQADGVVSGHIHRATTKDVDGVQYWNCGDWVESCTAVVENEDGSMVVMEWVDTWTTEGKRSFVLRELET
jgi:UDP-2,3-diacylglucosamine pyrophosphatase LpxH